jgi:hypothetical protein
MERRGKKKRQLLCRKLRERPVIVLQDYLKNSGLRNGL